MSWLFLVIAILLEVAGTTCMKLSQGFAKWLPSALMFGFYLLSFASLAMALKQIEVSTAYAVWSGLGTATIAVIGCWYFGESVNASKVLGTGLVIAGVVALNLSSNGH